jgi:hypothetical protein
MGRSISGCSTAQFVTEHNEAFFHIYILHFNYRDVADRPELSGSECAFAICTVYVHPILHTLQF